MFNKYDLLNKHIRCIGSTLSVEPNLRGGGLAAPLWGGIWRFPLGEPPEEYPPEKSSHRSKEKFNHGPNPPECLRIGDQGRGGKAESVTYTYYLTSIGPRGHILLPNGASNPSLLWGWDSKSYF